MNTKEQIIQAVKRFGRVTSPVLVKSLGISRQAVSKHLRELVYQGVLLKTGSTKNSSYSLKKKAAIREKTAAYNLGLELNLAGLDEDRVFKQLTMRFALRRRMSENSFSIMAYAFTEMLNNAIDHSNGAKVSVAIEEIENYIQFTLKDNGVGILANLRAKLDLATDFDAIEHLLKGKQTTAPDKHSGQGIFFTSKIADQFEIRSSDLSLVIDNEVDDVFLNEKREIKGTSVRFKIKKMSRKDLSALFEEYSNDDFEFDKTLIRVVLSGKEAEHISRSQARKLLYGLDKFKRIVLDFKKVSGIGQGFADEIFRVFADAHPQISFECLNMNKAVHFMVKRAKAG